MKEKKKLEKANMEQERRLAAEKAKQEAEAKKIARLDLLFKIAFGIAVFILIKVLLERLIASLFEIDDLVDQYLFQKISYKNYLGLILVPINAILIFSITPTLRIIYILIILLLLNIFDIPDQHPCQVISPSIALLRPVEDSLAGLTTLSAGKPP